MNKKKQTPLAEIALQALQLMDLTSLTDQESNEDIIALCQQAKSRVGNTAAICIFPRFIPVAKQQLAAQGNGQGRDKINIATVTNFPHGNSNIDIAVAETKAAVAYGADEVDVVFPYKALMSGDTEVGFSLIKACKAVCPNDVLLKVIIESGELHTPELIKQASEIAIKAGADFIKTSTGKVSVNATPLAAEIMLKVIAATNNQVGFKAAGGVKNANDAKVYMSLAATVLGESWVTSAHFRFGASGLLNNLLSTLHADGSSAPSSDY